MHPCLNLEMEVEAGGRSMCTYRDLHILTFIDLTAKAEINTHNMHPRRDHVMLIGEAIIRACL